MRNIELLLKRQPGREIGLLCGTDGTFQAFVHFRFDEDYGTGDLCDGLGSTPEEALAVFDAALGKVYEEYGIPPEKPLELGVETAEKAEYELTGLDVLAAYTAIMHYRLHILEGKSEHYAMQQALGIAVDVQKAAFWKELGAKGFEYRDLNQREWEMVREITKDLIDGFKESNF